MAEGLLKSHAKTAFFKAILSLAFSNLSKRAMIERFLKSHTKTALFNAILTYVRGMSTLWCKEQILTDTNIYKMYQNISIPYS